jgi:hypothetical protein
MDDTSSRRLPFLTPLGLQGEAGFLLFGSQEPFCRSEIKIKEIELSGNLASKKKRNILQAMLNINICSKGNTAVG